jgi:hypothetical protein
MPRYYRALISVPITAEDDEDALEKAGDYARSLLLPGGITSGGHMERLAEVHGGGMATMRVVTEDEDFLGQLL